jgi:hypothetical protein
MASTRAYAAGAVLPDGDLLVVGGQNEQNGVEGSAERFDVATRTWSPTGPVLAPRTWARATLLRSGRVLIAGGGWGGDESSYPTVTEVYTPSTSTWTSAGHLGIGRGDPQSVLLKDGRVLLIGGEVMGQAQNAVDIYNPATGAWTSAAPLRQARWNASATLLRDGRVLVAGGLEDFSPLSSVEIYDPAGDRWTPAADMTQPRHTQSAVRLTDGRVLVMGTYWGGDPSSTEIYDPATNSWVPAAPMTSPRAYLSAASLPGGRVIAVGGNDTEYAQTTAELYDPCRNTWTAVDSMTYPRASFVMGLSGRKVIVAGGVYGSYGAHKGRSTEILALSSRW